MQLSERRHDRLNDATVITSVELDDLVEQLVHDIQEVGGEMSLSDLIDFPEKRKGIELSEVAAILERARNLGRIAFKDVLATLYIPVSQ